MPDKENQIKFEDDEMKELNHIQSIYIDTKNELGSLSITRLRLEQQMENIDVREDELKSNFINNQKSEKDFLDKVTKKYGNGTLDPETGIFTVVPE